MGPEHMKLLMTGMGEEMLMKLVVSVGAPASGPVFGMPGGGGGSANRN